MGTRSTIALEYADGTVQSVYCHYDGYLAHNGQILLNSYADPFKVRQLIDLGGLSSLGPNIGEKHLFDNPYKYGTPEATAWSEAKRKMCTFYGRDRGETDTESAKFANFSEYVIENDHQEYDYILRQVDGKPVWFVRCYATHDSWVTIEQAFVAEKEYTE